MKTITTFLFTLFLFSSFASIKTTVANGSWFDANIWSPVGVPLMEDSVIINHNITVNGNYVDFGANWLIVNLNASITGDSTFALHGNLKMKGLMDMKIIAIGDGDSTQIYGVVGGGKYIPGNPSNFNYNGIIQCDSLIIGDNFENYGSINVLSLVIGAPTFINHSGANVAVSNMATFGGLVNNNQGASMNIESLLTSENIINDGDISCGSWTHAQGIASGTTGLFCITNCFVNVATIQGTLDVCDASVGGFCDMNMGTIAATVTQCAQGPCAINGQSQISEFQFIVYPNPVNEYVDIELPIIGSINIIDLSGRLILQLEGLSKYHIDLSNFEAGNYFIRSSSNLVKFVVQ